ncbi:MAG TPA: class I SAM-dependent methyltransferase [Tepidisphaeraceae bacterium]|nr:class I SAM-dependent methyltransferase [Tepidisphaeraceae bacterium]
MSMNTFMRERVRRAAPWWAKGALKLVLAKVPLGYSLLHKLALARHGGMENPAWALDAFLRHYDNADFARKAAGGFTVLELGPGDSLFNAIIARAYGAASTTLLDVGPFANTDLRLYRQMADHLRGKGLDAPDLSAAQSIGDVLGACNARYETRGIASLRELPSESFDFVFSNGVIQSVWRDEVPETLRHLRRVVRPDGTTVHSIDLRDTMGQSLNHLRFSEKRWESDWFRKAGFYTNRLRVSEIVRLGREAGFEPDLDEVNRWPQIPVARRKLDAAYQSAPDEDLLVATIRIILRPAGQATGAAAAAERETAETAGGVTA